jgi:hypothetical protein
MKTFFKKCLTCLQWSAAAAAICLAGVVSTTNILAQEELPATQEKEEAKRIRIVNRDGQELSPKIVIQKGAKVEGAAGDDSIQITSENGEFIIRDSDGTERKINAVSVMITSSQKTTVENGEEKTEVVKKAIVTDADGKTYEIDLTKDDQAAAVEKVMPPMVLRKSSVGKFMIGVAAQPVSEALAEQLSLEPNTGLVVEQVSPNSAAEKAGLQVDDVLLFADQKALNKVEDLVNAVQEAGKNKITLALTLVRDEKEMSLEITPEERNLDLMFEGPGAMGFQIKIDPDFQAAMEKMGDFDFDWAQAGPGIVINPGEIDPEAIRAQLEVMQAQHRAHLDQMKKVFAEREKAFKLRKDLAERRGVESDQAVQMQDLQAEIKRLRDEIESLKKEKK